MKVLMISGDKSFGPGNPRYDLQCSAVDELDVFVWPQVHSLRQIFSAARHNRYDVITAQDPFWRGHIAHHLVQFFGGRLNIQVHTDLSAYSPLEHFFARLQLRNADSVRVVSEKIKEQVLAMGVRAPVSVLPLYIDALRFKSVIRNPHDKKIILWIGRFEVEKDPTQAIELFSSIMQKIPDAKLIMLGKGSLENSLRAKAKGLPVEFPGWQDPLLYFARADVVFSTSRHESFGVSIIEALAAGVPVVAPDVGIAKEAGAIVVPREQLGEAVVEVLNSNKKGELKLRLPSAGEWAVAWLVSLG
jgi:glycosyltransferase involved in cell wall biosynthesis